MRRSRDICCATNVYKTYLHINYNNRITVSFYRKNYVQNHQWSVCWFAMEDTRLPKITFYSELEHGRPTRSHGGQLKRYKDMLKTNMRACDLPSNELENLRADRSSWRSSFKKQVSDFERRRILSPQDKRVQRKTGRQLLPDCGFTCDTCSHVCASRIGVISHQRTHLWSRDPSCRPLSPSICNFWSGHRGFLGFQ